MMWSELTLGPLFKFKQGYPNSKNAYNLLIIGLTGVQCESNL